MKISYSFTKILLLVCFIQGTINAQISRDVVNKTGLKVAITDSKLPLLKLNGARITKIQTEYKAIGTQVSRLTGYINEAATKANALNETLNIENLSTRKAHLYFNGRYDGRNLIIETGRRSHIGIVFDAQKGKRYRITMTLNSTLDDGSYDCTNRRMMHISFNRSRIEVPIKAGENTIDFLVQSERDGRQSMLLFAHNSLTCGGQTYRKGGLNEVYNVKIRELKE